MNKETEDRENKLYYPIGEVAQMLNVNPSLIRFWEKEFPDIKPKKNRKGNRLFTKKDIESLQFIYYLVKEQGHTLDGAKKILRNKKKAANKEYEIVTSLQKLRSFLVEIRNTLDRK